MKSLDRKNIAHCRDDSFHTLPCDELLVSLPTLLRFPITRLPVRPMVNKRADRNLSEELRHATGMVHVVVSEQDKINFRHTGFLGCGDNAVCVTSRVAWPAGIDKQRSTFRRDEEGRLPAFDVHKVDFQGLAGRGLSRLSQGEERAEKNHERYKK